eukprot:scaffold6632_cov36-Tisochrysis_lutea.AAC.1
MASQPSAQRSTAAIERELGWSGPSAPRTACTIEGDGGGGGAARRGIAATSAPRACARRSSNLRIREFVRESTPDYFVLLRDATQFILGSLMEGTEPPPSPLPLQVK